MNVVGAVIAFVVGLGGVGLGATLSRRNERRAQAERLLVEAVNDAVRAIAAVAGGGGPEAQRLYAAAVSRVALHGSPTVVAAFRRFQDDATTVTDDGRKRLLAAVRAARAELGYRPASDEDLRVLLFGGGPVAVEHWEQEVALVAERVVSPAVPPVAAGTDLDRLMGLAENAPIEAVLESFKAVEWELQTKATRSGIEDGERKAVTRLAEELLAKGTITPATAEAVRGLTVLRNLAAHGRGQDAGPQRAREFVVLANAVLFTLTRSEKEE